MTEHLLKTWANVYDDVASGLKRFEFRRDDRGFAVGDILVLRKVDPGTAWPYKDHWGNPIEQRVRVTYILRNLFDVPPDFCIMSIEPAGDR